MSFLSTSTFNLPGVPIPQQLAIQQTHNMISLLRKQPQSVNLLWPRLGLGTKCDKRHSRALHRSYLYVPTSSDRMLEKSISSGSDVIIYDLEDSVAPSEKLTARMRLEEFLQKRREDLKPMHIAVRINDVTTSFYQEDIARIVSHPMVKTIVLPKIQSTMELDCVSDLVSVARHRLEKPSLNIIPSIESAKGMWNLGSIAGWQSSYGNIAGGNVNALLFAAEDYCADTGIIRTPSRQELLYTRSQIVITAKAFGLSAIDMVCVDFRNEDVLKDEASDGRQLGFTGKQAIHPAQVPVINATFVPTPKEIKWASRILHAMDLAHRAQKGATHLDGKMLDAPMIKQAQKIIDIAKLAGFEIPPPAPET